jgi:negative regulator of flagellin synthesis FlgM
LKINTNHPLLPVKQPAQESPGKVQGPMRGDSAKPDPAVLTHLHRETGGTDQDINVAQVEAIREAIRDGRLDIRTDRIADSLIASVQGLLGR